MVFTAACTAGADAVCKGIFAAYNVTRGYSC